MLITTIGALMCLGALAFLSFWGKAAFVRGLIGGFVTLVALNALPFMIGDTLFPLWGLLLFYVSWPLAACAALIVGLTKQVPYKKSVAYAIEKDGRRAYKNLSEKNKDRVKTVGKAGIKTAGYALAIWLRSKGLSFLADAVKKAVI